MRHVTVIHCCDCTWYFDSDLMRFRSTVKCAGAGTPTPWLPYDRLIVDGSRAFVVVLDRAGTRRLRSWQHGPDCSCTESGDRAPDFAPWT